ncbi:MAG: hypothetical protein HY517_01040 [Candidatus Aenigmarchaeota archaeon]|nr:hypothetical protein [Candidatus Aenigmarchaeota archaeon]
MKYLIIFSVLFAILVSGCTTTTTTLPAGVSGVAAIDQLTTDAGSIEGAQSELNPGDLDDIDGALADIGTI